MCENLSFQIKQIIIIYVYEIREHRGVLSRTAWIFHDFSLHDYGHNGFSSQRRPTMRVVKNRRSRNNVPDNDTITPVGYVHCNIPPRSISFYRESNYVTDYDKTGGEKAMESDR